MAFSFFNFGLGLTGTDSASKVFDGAIASVEKVWDTTSRYASSAVQSFERVGSSAASAGEKTSRFLADGFSEVSEAVGAASKAVETYAEEAANSTNFVADQAEAAGGRISNALTTAFGESTKGVGANLDNISQGLESLGKTLTLNMGDDFNENALNLADATAKLATQFGDGAAEADVYNNRIIEMSALTGRSVDTFTGLANSLGKAGIDFSKLSKATQSLSKDGETLTTTWGDQESLSALIDAFDGVDGSEAAELAQGMKSLGLNTTKSLDSVTQFQKNFKMPGMIEELPEATQGAIRAIATFGSEITGSGKQVIDTTLQMGAVFAKTFGRSMKESVQEAARTMQQFHQESLGFRKLATGLSTSFSPLTTTFLEVGESLDSVRGMMEESGKSRFGPIKFAQQIMEINQQLKDSGQGMAAERFMIQIREQAPEAVKKLVSVQGALALATNEMERIEKLEKGNKGLATFQKMAEQMWSTGKVAIDVFKNLITLSKTIVGLLFEPIAEDIFGSVGNGLKGFNDKLAATIVSLKKTDSYFQKRVAPTLIVVGKALVAVGSAATLAASAVGTLATGWAIKKAVVKSWEIIAGIFPRIGAAGTKVGGVFKFLGAAMKGFAKKILMPIMAFKSLVTAFGDMAAVFSDPDASGMEKFQAIIRAGFVGVGDFIDTFFMGLPGKLTNWILGTEGSFSSAMGALAESGMSAIGRFFSRDTVNVVSDWIESQFNSATKWLQSFDLTGITKSLTKGFVAGVGGLGIFLAESIVSGLWSAVKLTGSALKAIGLAMLSPIETGKAAWTGFWSWWSDDSTSQSSSLWISFANMALESIQHIKEIGSGLMSGIFEGFANAAGTNMGAVTALWNLFWLDREKEFVQAGFWGLDFATGFGRVMSDIFLGIGMGWDVMIQDIASSGEKFFRAIGGFGMANKFQEAQIGYTNSIKLAGEEHRKTQAKRIAVDKLTVKARESEIARIDREANKQNLVLVTAQKSHKASMQAERSEKKATSAFNKRRTAEERAKGKAATTKDKGKASVTRHFADIWRNAQAASFDRTKKARASLIAAGKSGKELQKGISSVAQTEAKKLAAIKGAMATGDAAKVKAAYDAFMAGKSAEVVSRGGAENVEGSSMGMAVGGRGATPVAAPKKVTPRAPVESVVETAKPGRDAGLKDLEKRVRKGEKQDDASIIAQAVEELGEVFEKAFKGRSRESVHLVLDKDRLIRILKRERMGRAFTDVGSGT